MNEGKLQARGEFLVEQIIRVAIHGVGPVKGAAVVAEEHLAGSGGDREKAVRRLIATHVRLAAVSGFVTGLGGVVTLPLTIPASLIDLYILGARMSAGIAFLRGYDLDSEEARSDRDQQEDRLSTPDQGGGEGSDQFDQACSAGRRPGRRRIRRGGLQDDRVLRREDFRARARSYCRCVA